MMNDWKGSIFDGMGAFVFLVLAFGCLFIAVKLIAALIRLFV